MRTVLEWDGVAKNDDDCVGTLRSNARGDVCTVVLLGDIIRAVDDFQVDIGSVHIIKDRMSDICAYWY